MITDPWAVANIKLRRERDAMDAFKKRENQAAEARRQFEAEQGAKQLPAVRLGGH